MKTKSYSLLILLLILSISIILSCSNSTGPEDDHSFPAAIDSVATDITLYVNSIGFGIAPDTLDMNTEDTITINYVGGGSYFIYAKADGFYTELYYCANGETITVDLDAIPQVPNSITGVIFEEEMAYYDLRYSYFSEIDIVLTQLGGSSISGKTDSLGRYGFSNLSECEYLLHSDTFHAPLSFDIINTVGTDYKELFCLYEGFSIDAPNIYLYPETTIDISVNIDFPNGGEITKSEPKYNNGWKVNVTPEGIIDGQYDYLFYKTRQPISLNYLSGWLLDGNELENEIRSLLMNLGFVGREIDDFVDYWLPRFGNPNYLAVYPQDVESLITLTIDPAPDNLLRMIFFFRPLNAPIQLEELPLPDAIQRDGFTAIEWGGILLSQ